MSFLGLHKLVTYGVAGLGLFALTLGFEIGPLRSAWFVLGYLASVFADGRIIHHPRWSRTWTQLVVGAFLVQVGRGLAGDPPLELAVEYAAFLQISRLFNRRDGKDHQQIAVLAFLHLVAATVLTTDLSYAFAFLGFVVVIPWMLALSHLRREIEEHYPTPGQRPGAAGEAPEAGDLARVLASKRLIGAPFLLGTALLVVPLVLSTAVLFLAFPRVGLGVFSFGQHAGQSVVGFGKDVRLGGFGVLRDDPTVVLRVTLPKERRPLPAHLQPPLRLRGTSFDRYDGERWSRSQDDASEAVRGSSAAYFAIERTALPGDLDVEIGLEHLEEPVVFLPPGTVGLVVPPRQRRGQPIPRRLDRGPGLDLRYRDADDVGLRYQATVSPEAGPVGGRKDALDPEERGRYLQLPPGPAQPGGPIARLADRLAEGAADDGEVIRRFRRYLRRDGGLRYSLELPRVPDDADPLAHFLFTARSGHCEYFSTALAVMLRTQGIPSRNVTGFLGGELNRFGGYFAIRQGDAHSWVEAFVEGRGWLTVDPTPATARAGAGRQPSLFDGARAFLDALRARWVGYVVTYDFQSQLDALTRAYELLARMRQERAAAPWAPPDAGAIDLRLRGPRAGQAWPWLVGGGLLGVLALGLWGRRAWGRRRGDPELAGLSPASRRLVQAYRLVDRALARAGLGRPASRTPQAHADQLARARAPGAVEVGRITSTYLEARFAGRSPSPAELARVDADLRTLRATLARSHGHRPDQPRR